MQVSCISFCTSSNHASKDEWLLALIAEVQKEIILGSEVIVYPELFFLDLYQYFTGSHREKLIAVSDFVNSVILPSIDQLKFKGILCLGTFPRVVGNMIYNTCPVLIDDKWLFQDKIHLTPWEIDFTPGDNINIFSYKGIKIGILICYDVEQPHLAQELKKHNLHLLLVPSATTDRNGSERVLRCSSARSIECGAAVIAVPLIGKSICDLIDANEGRQGYFLPAQSDVKSGTDLSTYTCSDHQIVQYQLSLDLLLKLKLFTTETKPYLESPKPFKIKVFK